MTSIEDQIALLNKKTVKAKAKDKEEVVKKDPVKQYIHSGFILNMKTIAFTAALLLAAGQFMIIFQVKKNGRIEIILHVYI